MLMSVLIICEEATAVASKKKTATVYKRPKQH